MPRWPPARCSRPERAAAEAPSALDRAPHRPTAHPVGGVRGRLVGCAVAPRGARCGRVRAQRPAVWRLQRAERAGGVLRVGATARAAACGGRGGAGRPPERGRCGREGSGGAGGCGGAKAAGEVGGDDVAAALTGGGARAALARGSAHRRSEASGGWPRSASERMASASSMGQSIPSSGSNAWTKVYCALGDQWALTR